MPNPSKPAGGQTLTASCGHPVKFAPAKGDRFVEQRRRNAEGRPCPECRRRERETREAVRDFLAKRKEEATARRQERAKEMKKNGWWGRLPRGSYYCGPKGSEGIGPVWNGKKWEGGLVLVRDENDQLLPEPVIFYSEGNGSRTLWWRLDKLYRAWLIPRLKEPK